DAKSVSRPTPRHFLQTNENHIAILKLRRNEPLTAMDLAELERLFIAAGALATELESVKADGGLGLFVRSLVGLDREAAVRAFEAFMARRTLSADQIEFIDMIIEHLTERGAMDPRLLYQSPFTDINPRGLGGVFDKPDAEWFLSFRKCIDGQWPREACWLDAPQARLTASHSTMSGGIRMT